MIALRKHDEAGLDYTELQPRDYSGYFFRKNPFPSLAVAEERPTIFVDRERIMKLVYDITKEAFLTKNSQTLILQGIYGSGKSHTLKYIKFKVNGQLATQSGSKGIAVYVQSPGGDLKYFYSNIVGDLGIDFLTTQAMKIIFNLVKEHPEMQEHIFDIELRKRVMASDIESIPMGMFGRSGVRILSLYRNIREVLGEEIKSDDLLTAFLNLTNEDNSLLAWRWLLGENLDRNDRQSLKVSKNIEDSDDVLRAFSTLRYLLSLSQYEMLYILVDELEKISELHRITKSRYFDDLRHLIDLNPKGICLILCVTPTGWAEIDSAGHPLSRRLMANVDWLNPFNLDEAVRLIAAYIDVERQAYLLENKITENEFIKRIRSPEIIKQPDLFPFTLPAIEAIFEISEGTISEILRICKKLIDGGCEEKYCVFMDRESILKYFPGVNR